MRTSLAVACVLLAAPHTPAAEPPGAAPAVDFNRDVRPILADNCYACHGPDEKTRKAKLRLDTRDGAVEGGAVVPGKPDASELLKRLTSADPDLRMPPAKTKKPPLTAEQVAVVTRWIAEGAKYSEHWSFAKLARPEVPKVENPAFPVRNAPDLSSPARRNPIDAFILYKLKQAGAKPSPEADRVTLIRRLSFDLTGLPPAPEDVRAFVNDKAPDAYEKLVERLLASPHHGERLAVWWLDLVRYADSIGYHSDNPMNVSPYRDYVIRAFNANKPFDRFTLEQLAGDLLAGRDDAINPKGGRKADPGPPIVLPPAALDRRVASAYNRLLQTTEEGGAQPREYEAKYASDRVRNYGQVWLGGTAMCAECHDHKFDPYTQKDFYSLAAFFADIQEPAVGGRGPGTPIASPEQERKLAELTTAVAAAQAKLAALAVVLPAPALNKERAASAAAVRAKADYEKNLPRVLLTVSGPPRTVRILPRGNWLDASGPVVTPATPGFLPPLPKLADPKARYTRLDLAKWTVSPDNPLTARVTVNRLWRLFFGYGIARSLEESGTQGQLPTHPELLDWLASEFMNPSPNPLPRGERGQEPQPWDVRHMIRLMVTSSAYRQSSAETAAVRERDPANRLFSRQSRERLDAEFVRDTALAVSGLLNRDVGGPSVKPFQPAGYWSALNFPAREWQKDAGPSVYRRGMYTHWQRSFPHPAMVALDAPSREECTCDRPRSNIPQQALVLLNDPEFVEAARVFAQRVLGEKADDTVRIARAFERATGRTPKAEEAAVLASLLKKHRTDFAAKPDDAKKLLAVGDTPAPNDVKPEELAAWTSVCRTILNLHETITRQ